VNEEQKKKAGSSKTRRRYLLPGEEKKDSFARRTIAQRYPFNLREKRGGERGLDLAKKGRRLLPHTARKEKQKLLIRKRER